MAPPHPASPPGRILGASAALALLVGCGARTGLLGDGGASGNQAGGGTEICNGLDDNGNGEVDEGLGMMECGVGACHVAIAACDQGHPATCVPGVASAEVCNGIDDDCDGAVDEGLGIARLAGPFTVDPALDFLADASIAASDTGFYFAYSTGFDGEHPTTNVFHGALDANGSPTVTRQPLTMRNITNGPRISRTNGGFFAAYCGRFAGEDRAATAVISEDSAFSEFGVRPPASNSCGAGTPDGIGTGTRHLFSWTDNSTLDVRLDIADTSGVSLSSRLLSASNGDLYSHPRLARSGGRILLSYAIRRNNQALLRVHRLDLLGQDVDHPIELPPPAPAFAWRDAQLAAAPAGGFYLLAQSAEYLPIQARFDGDGRLVEGPAVDESGLISQSALGADPAGGYVLASDAGMDGPPARLVRLDDHGGVTDVWDGASDPVWGNDSFAWPAVSAAHGRIVVLYTSLASGTPDHPELRTVTFGCAPLTH